MSTRNVGEGDFAMLAGYPGVTFRHRMASEFVQQVGWQLPTRVALSQSMIDAIDKAATTPSTRVLYASQVQGLKNTLKRAQGELDGLRRSRCREGARSRRGADAGVAVEATLGEGDACGHRCSAGHPRPGRRDAGP